MMMSSPLQKFPISPCSHGRDGNSSLQSYKLGHISLKPQRQIKPKLGWDGSLHKYIKTDLPSMLNWFSLNIFYLPIKQTKWIRHK